MIGEEDLRDAFRRALGFLVNGKLVGVNSFVFMYAGFQMPARKIAAVGARESAGAKTADRRALPVTVVNQIGELGLAGAGVGERLADGWLPGEFRNRVSRPCREGRNGDEEKNGTLRKAEFHGASGVVDGWVWRICRNFKCKIVIVG